MAFTYRGLQATLETRTVTDSEVDRQLERLRQQTPRITEVTDRPTQAGDEIILDYAGFCDDVQFPGGTADKQTLTLGSGAFIPGFEEQLLDKVPGETVLVSVTFPTEYHAPELAGKEAKFHCVIHAIRLKEEFQLDDDFAKEVGGVDTLEEMRRALKDNMQRYTDQQAEMDLQDHLLRQAADTLELEITEEAISEAVNQQLESLKGQLAQKGLSLEMYCSFMGTTEEDLRKDARPEAIQAVRSQAAIEKIVALEGITVEADEMEGALELICQQNRMTREQLEAYRSEAFDAALTKSVLATKALALIRSAAEITIR